MSSGRLSDSQHSPRKRLQDQINHLEEGIRMHKATRSSNPVLIDDLEAKLERLKSELKQLPE